MNNQQEKERFFAAHWGQRILKYEGDSNNYEVSVIHMPYSKQHKFLELKPLSSITDEDAIAIWKMFRVEENEAGYDTSWQKFKEEVIKSGEIAFGLWDFYHNCMDAYDKARELGYAVAFNGYSVEQMIEMNWLTLTE